MGKMRHFDNKKRIHNKDKDGKEEYPEKKESVQDIPTIDETPPRNDEGECFDNIPSPFLIFIHSKQSGDSLLCIEFIEFY